MNSIKSECVKCKQSTNHNILKSHKVTWEYRTVYSKDDYFICECAGCETISFVHTYVFSENDYIDEDGKLSLEKIKLIYPKVLTIGSAIEDIYSLPKIIRPIYRETIMCLENGQPILAAVGFRSLLEAVCNEIGLSAVSDIKSLEAKIDFLKEKGLLSGKESNRLHSIRFMGNDAVHELAKPRKDQLKTILYIINNLLHNLYVIDDDIKQSLDYIINNYEDFELMIEESIKENMIGSDFLLDDIIGKSVRRIEKGQIERYKSVFLGDVKDNKFEFLTYVPKPGNPLVKVVSKP